MLKTVYSNAYEILEAYLTAEVTTDKKASANPFERVRIISSTGAINNRLRQHLAQVNGICSGIDFWTTQSWFHNYAGIGVGNPDQAQDFLWVIWTVLTDEFIDRYERLRTFFSHRTTAREKALARYELSAKIATVFNKYVNYRFDWVAEWMGLGNEKTQTVYDELNTALLEKEKKSLLAHPDFGWQKAIWEKLAETKVWAGRETLKLYANPESLEIKFANEPETLHFFEPTGISPLMLPVIKLLSEHGHKVYVYMLNPCVEYWFDSFADSDDERDTALNYLRKNAASTRAMINRFWTFTPDEADNSDHRPQMLPDLTKAPLQKLDIWTQSETERLDLVQDDSCLLHTAQRAILQNSSLELPCDFSPDDRSIRLIKAPTLTREVQNAINMIQDYFADKTLALKPEDVLIVTPEIEKTAPVFEACMQALPPQYRMDYQIFGKASDDANMSARSLVDLGKLLMNSMSLRALNAWLELPTVGEALELDLSDLNIIHDWLLAAGFRDALNTEHFIATHPQANEDLIREAEDGTLERAIERLSWGYVFKEGTFECSADILPVQHGADRFADIAEHQDLFLKLCLLTEKLKNAFIRMRKLGDEALPADLSLWAYALLDDFFAKKIDRMALMSIRGVLRSQEFALTTVPEPITMPLYVYWRALEERIGEPSDRNPAVGRITLAPMSTFRGLPFKVIIALGLGENSGFPGNQRFEEFDLMGADSLKRQNDRDSRSDNRNVFLDLFLSARERFVCSYCVGSNKKTPQNPSPVVVDLLDFLTQNAEASEEQTTLEAKQLMSDSLTVDITLTDTSPENFKTTPTRGWKSFMTETLEALRIAQSTHYSDPEPMMLKGPVNKALFSETLYLEELLAFVKGRMQWLQGRLGFRDYDNSVADTVPIISDKDSLEMHILRTQVWTMLQEGKTVDDILRRVSLDPTKGTESIRLLQYEEDVRQISKGYSLKKEIQSLADSQKENLLLDLGNSGLFETLQADGIEVLRFHLKKNKTSEEVLWSDSIENGKPYLLEVASSKTALSQAIVKAAAVNASGLEANLIVIDLLENNSVKIYKAIGKIRGLNFVQRMTALMREVISRGCLVTSAFPNNLEPVMWRGNDYDSARIITDELFKYAAIMIEPDMIYPQKNDDIDRSQAMLDFDNTLEILLVGGAR